MISSLSDVFALERTGPATFGGATLSRGARTFGGHLLAQATIAAALTAGPDRWPHSIHAHFLRPGISGARIELAVETIRDGASFSLRSIVVSQDGRDLVRATVSLHVGEAGEDWQRDHSPRTPALPPLSEETPLAKYDVTDPFELRAVNPWTRGAPLQLHPYWVRATEDLGENRLWHQAAVLVLSDIGVSGSAMRPGRPLRAQRASVSMDHAFWWHRPVRIDQWVIVDVASTTNAHGRGFARGEIATQSGELLASFVQEAVLREPGDPAR